jgi:hypothetical protein
MLFQLTQLAINALASNPSLRPTNFVLGSGTGYTPSPSDTNIHGSSVYASALTSGTVINANVTCFSIVLPYSMGPYTFGEIGLFTPDNMLFALAVTDVVMTKAPLADSLRFDCYLSANGTEYNMWLDTANTANAFQLGVLNSVDNLPAAAAGTVAPCAYIVKAAIADSFRAFTDGGGLWSFDAYEASSTQVVQSATSLSVTVPRSSYVGPTAVLTNLDYVVQFVSGVAFSACRRVSSIVISGSTVTIGFITPLNTLPIAGDSFVIMDHWVGHRVQIPIWIQGPLAPSDIIYKVTPSVNLVLASGLPGSTCNLDTAATSAFVLTLNKNGVAVGTFNFAAASTQASVTFTSNVWFNAGTDVFSIVGPAIPDLTASNFSITIAGSY